MLAGQLPEAVAPAPRVQKVRGDERVEGEPGILDIPARQRDAVVLAADAQLGDLRVG